MCLKWKAGGGVIGVIVVIYLLIFLTVFYLFIFKKALNKICTLISLCKYIVFNPMTNKDSILFYSILFYSILFYVRIGLSGSKSNVTYRPKAVCASRRYYESQTSALGSPTSLVLPRPHQS